MQFEGPSSIVSFQSKVMSEGSISLILEEIVCWEKGKSPDIISIMKFSFWNLIILRYWAMGSVAYRYLALLQNPCSSCYHPHFSLHMAPTDKLVAIAEADTLLVISRLGILHTNLLGRVVDVMTMEGFSCK
jgi:hypothetical protein